ncbi:MAG: hypothetical protein FGM32_05145 [Candidatus Kapabacteria bacterium]|nr:hypothetical protein [Candidatus Kapabacteria bacterium]
MKIFAIIALVAGTLFASVDASAQGSLTPAAQAPTVIKPKMKLAEVKGVVQFLGGIEIRGGEVEAFLDTRKVLTDAIDAATKASKKDDDALTLEMRGDQVQNLFTLMQRGSLKGAEADTFNNIVTALKDAVKAAQPSGK